MATADSSSTTDEGGRAEEEEQVDQEHLCDDCYGDKEFAIAEMFCKRCKRKFCEQHGSVGCELQKVQFIRSETLCKVSLWV